MGQPTPPGSPQEGDGPQSVASSSTLFSTPNEQSEATGGSSPVRPGQPRARCDHIQGCTTGSQPRKAISHLFGRNKLCTKAIPQDVWVILCRKHYQRSRYRQTNADWALTQVKLVVKQIEKVQQWSDDNVRANRRGDGFLQHWTIQARKREAKRIQAKSASASRKQYDTASLLEIVQGIQKYLVDNNVEFYPDIEILPSITTDEPQTGRRKKKTQTRRKANKEHQRSRTSVSSSTMPNQSITQSLAATDNNHAYQPLPNNETHGLATMAGTQAGTNLWTQQSYSSNTVLPAPVTQQYAGLPTNQDNIGAQQAFAAQYRPPHARSMSENSMIHGSGYMYRSRVSQANQRYQQQNLLPSYTLPPGYAFPTTYQDYGGNNNFNVNGGSNPSSSENNARFFGSFTGGPTGLTTQRQSDQGLQRPASVSGRPPHLSSTSSMSNMGNNDLANYSPHGLPVVPAEDHYRQYQQHVGTRQAGAQQHHSLQSGDNVLDYPRYMQQLRNQQAFGFTSAAPAGGYNQWRPAPPPAHLRPPPLAGQTVPVAPMDQQGQQGQQDEKPQHSLRPGIEQMMSRPRALPQLRFTQWGMQARRNQADQQNDQDEQPQQSRQSDSQQNMGPASDHEEDYKPENTQQFDNRY
ncbi:hypothetical protein VPNG_06885 [Cytospora leucostoma]|uniref:Uncharacterized protein n=1 Tax=Cytospora leucostoma TaxID=1230097 RepID=A0A423WXE2_9PEZI|nr:hypothetical protein VPNG_06885 [Cytospora leucostoma]